MKVDAMFNRKRLAVRMAGITLACAASFMITAPAHAADTDFIKDADVHYLQQCGRFWPSVGRFQTTHDGNEFSAQLVFKLSAAQKKALLCVDEFLELDFHILGFKAPAEWDGYSVTSDIPGAVHDTAKEDRSSDATPGVTNIKVADLVPNREYSATINFSLPLANDPKGPRVSIEWVPSHWASGLDEKAVCYVGGFGTPDMCIFGTTRAYLSHGYTNVVSLPFDGYRFWEFKS